MRIRMIVMIGAAMCWTVMSLGIEMADEMLLLSFEKDEMQKMALGVKEFDADGNAYSVWPFSKRGSGLYHQWFRIKKGDATRGEWAFFFSVTKRGWGPGDYIPLLDWRDQRGAVGRGMNRDILNTGPGPGSHRGWLDKIPGGRDWSGYDLARMDVKCASPAVVRLDIEDEDVAPAVRRRFSIPAGKWVTVELDLRKAVEARGLDPSKMANFWVFVEGVAGKATVLLDNLRLVKENVKPELPLIVDEAPYTTEPRVYAITPIESKDNTFGKWKTLEYPEKDEPSPKERDLDLPENRGPWRIDVPGSTADGGRLFVKQNQRWLPLAFDARRIIVPFHEWGRKRYYTRVAVTADGGTTWTGLKGGSSPTAVFECNLKSSSGVSVTRDGIYVIGKAVNCVGYGYPGDRVFAQKILLTNDGWKVYPATPVGRDLRHCTHRKTILGLVSGRIWAAWPLFGRLGNEIAAKYSDDGGRTWHSWRPGRRSMLPDSAQDGRSNRNRIFLAPFEARAACVISASRHTSVWVFDGKKWSDPFRYKVIGLESVVGLKGGRILLAHGRGKRGVYLFDGATFEKEQVAGYDGDCCLSVCGDEVLLFAPPAGTLKSFNKILCWSRDAAGAWTGPEEVVSEEKPISSFSSGPYSPETFAPLTWTCEGEPWVKVLLVPARREGNGKEGGTE